ncbi:choice-of-anchor A family protein [Paenibacillus sp. NEAU-GSW1]|uniref:choice-of-anchor A family protein n=1 Tax=Paenibacillus sp. NEAU-GSW1 TaxID=2682486 RepID=UPI0012E0DE0A|nr:choice-of-anchor A family protein [Paenibacillus sp. NEAU-GSW1]MUT64795.1 choice-of-anchor A family protein [Paenibacillus sp. NEAU-GSW1]
MAVCTNFGTANDYNVFVFGDHSQMNTSADGRVAAGGNVSYQDYSVGTTLPISTMDAQLIIEGNVSIVRGFNNGNTIIAPTSVVTEYSMINSNGVAGQPIVDERIDFAAARTFLQCTSTGWAGIPANGTAVNAFGGLVMTGTDPVLNVFTFNAADIDGSGLALASANNVLIRIPDGSYALINLLGNNIGFGSYVITIENSNDPNPPGSRLLWNVPEAAAFFHQSLLLQGTLLAPFATVTANGSGQINGQLIAAAYNGNFNSFKEAMVLYGGCLPDLCGNPSLSVAKTVQGAAEFTGVPGTPFVYAISVRNTGGVTITNIVIKDDVIGVQQDVAALNPGQVYVSEFNSAVRDGKAGEQYANVAVVTSDQTTAQSASANVIIGALPVNVSFTKSANKTSVVPGEQVIYTFFLTNNGNTDLLNATLTDVALGVQTTLGTVFAGELLNLPFVIPSNAAPGTSFVNTARLSASNLPFPGYIESSYTIQISETPSVGLTKETDTDVALPGDTITYRIRVSNDSLTTTVNNLQVIDGLLGLNKLIDTLPPGSSVVYRQPLVVPEGAPAGTAFTNTVTVQSAYGIEQASRTVRIGSSPRLLVAKDVDTQFANPGDTVQYLFTLINAGNTTLTDITITDSLLGINEAVAPIPIGERRLITANYVIPEGTPPGTLISNVLVVQSPALGTITDDAEVIVTVSPIPPRDATLSAIGFADRTTVFPNQSIVFSAVITNPSQITVRNIELRSPLFQYVGLLQELLPGQSYRIEGVFDVSAQTPPGTVITGSLIATSSQTAPVRVAADVTVLSEPKVELALSVAPTEVIQGEAETYNALLRNTGNTDLTNVFIRDSLLLRAVWINRFVVGSFLRGVVDIAVRSAPGSVVSTRLMLSSDQIEVESNAATYTVYGLTVQLSANRASVAIGETIVYSAVVSNPSLAEATEVNLIELIPPFTAAIAGSATRNGAPVSNASLAIGIPIGSLLPNRSVVITYEVVVRAEPANGLLPAQVAATFFFPSTARQLRGTSDSNQVIISVEEEEE